MIAISPFPSGPLISLRFSSFLPSQSSLNLFHGFLEDSAAFVFGLFPFPFTFVFRSLTLQETIKESAVTSKRFNKLRAVRISIARSRKCPLTKVSKFLGGLRRR
ncbi:hypothetical protein VNO77_05614 [Canavalia gladiata]|uniref:Uncharacterized protein n=1 Tax=Canavalia gladiata TaxID=3824 RepID=A0AAN9R5V4_CANGL